METLYLVSTSAEGLCLLKVMDLDFDKKGHCSKLEIEKKITLALFLSLFDGGICSFQCLVCKRVI